jgi:hypothetical protein
MENVTEKNLKHIFGLLKEAKFIEAMETYLHDDVILQEANGEPKHGKEFCVKFEDAFIKNDLAEFIRYDVGDFAVNGNRSFYEAVMELKLKDGSTMLVDQIVATERKDGKYTEKNIITRDVLHFNAKEQLNKSAPFFILTDLKFYILFQSNYS